MGNGIEKNSAKVMAVALAALLVVVGTSFFGDRLDIAKAIIMISTALILLFEVGIKRVMDLGNYREFTNVISAVFIVTLAAAALTSLAGWSLPAFIVGAIDYVIVIAAGWIAVEALV